VPFLFGDELKVRLARPEDVPAIHELWDEQEAILGVKVDRPDLFKEPVLLTLVVEHRGKIINAFYAEAVVEVCGIGVDPRGTVAMQRAGSQAMMFFRNRGFRWVRCFVPNRLAKLISKPLSYVGFVDQSDALTHFANDLREGA